MFNRFSRDVLGNSSAEVSDGDSDVPQGADTLVMTGGMSVVVDPEEEREAVAPPAIGFKTWSGNWTWPQALEADLKEKAEPQAFDLEFGWMKDADHFLLGHGPTEQRKPPEDQGKPLGSFHGRSREER
jgi:hypothetical protein